MGIISSVIIWHYDSKLDLQEEKHKQEITSMESIFSDSKQVFLIKDIIVNDISNIKPTKGEYFKNSNIYALKKLNGFDYIESKKDNLHSLFDRCNQKSFWKGIFNTKPIIQLTEKQQKVSDALIKYLKKKIFSKTNPTINYWIESNSNKQEKSCIIEFKATDEIVKKALKNTMDFFMNPILSSYNEEYINTFKKTKQKLDENNSQKIFDEFKHTFFNLTRGLTPKRQKIIIEKEKIFFMDYFLANRHVILLGFLNGKDINFVILSNVYNGILPDKKTENKFNYWLSQYRIIPSKKSD